MNPAILISRLGAGVISTVTGLGVFARFVGALFVLLPKALLRPRLIIDQINLIGN